MSNLCEYFFQPNNFCGLPDNITGQTMRLQIKIFAIILLVLSSHVIGSEVFGDKEQLLREKRQINGLPLVYPWGGTYKLLIGLSAPVQNREEVALLFAANFQYQYVQFTNISQLSQYYFIKEVSREEREADLMARRDERLVFYKSMGEMLTSKGMNGRDCVLRAICEAAQYPVEEEGFVGEILHVLLTPDYGRSPFDDEDPDWEELMSPYKDAAIAGRQMFSCSSIYSGCPEGQGVMELFSTLKDE